MNDHTKAAALEIAERSLTKGGYRSNATDIGGYAARLIIALDRGLAEEELRKAAELKKKMARE